MLVSQNDKRKIKSPKTYKCENVEHWIEKENYKTSEKIHMKW